MADYYTLWSTVINDLTREEFDWLDHVNAAIGTAVNEEDRSKFPEWLAEHYDLEDICSAQDIRLTEARGTRQVWFHSDGASGDELSIHAGIIHEFLKKFRPNDFHEIHWSAGCSRPIADEAYGGGCAFITAKHVMYMSTWDWAEGMKTNLSAGGEL